jgi:hypothetical protein
LVGGVGNEVGLAENERRRLARSKRRIEQQDSIVPRIRDVKLPLRVDSEPRRRGKRAGRRRTRRAVGEIALANHHECRRPDDSGGGTGSLAKRSVVNQHPVIPGVSDVDVARRIDSHRLWAAQAVRAEPVHVGASRSVVALRRGKTPLPQNQVGRGPVAERTQVLPAQHAIVGRVGRVKTRRGDAGIDRNRLRTVKACSVGEIRPRLDVIRLAGNPRSRWLAGVELRSGILNHSVVRAIDNVEVPA